MGFCATIFPHNLLIQLALKKNAKLHWPLQKVYSQPNRVATNHIHDVLIFYGDLSVHLANAEALHHQQLIW